MMKKCYKKSSSYFTVIHRFDEKKEGFKEVGHTLSGLTHDER